VRRRIDEVVRLMWVSLVMCRRATHMMGRRCSRHMWRPALVRWCGAHARCAALAHMPRRALCHVCRDRVVMLGMVGGHSVDR
jgi:hypothetical protein